MIDIMLANGFENTALLPYLEGKNTFNVQVVEQEMIPVHVGAEHCDMIILYDYPAPFGVDIIKKIKSEDHRVPIIYLVPEDQDQIIPQALRAGADDCMRTPMSFAELVARMEAILKRTADRTKERTLPVGGFVLYPDRQRLEYKDQKIQLTTKESLMLEMLFEYPNRPLTRADLLSKCWGRVDCYVSNSLDSYIGKIRKILSLNPRVQLETLRGQGFKLTSV